MLLSTAANHRKRSHRSYHKSGKMQKILSAQAVSSKYSPRRRNDRRPLQNTVHTATQQPNTRQSTRLSLVAILYQLFRRLWNWMLGRRQGPPPD